MEAFEKGRTEKGREPRERPNWDFLTEGAKSCDDASPNIEYSNKNTWNRSRNRSSMYILKCREAKSRRGREPGKNSFQLLHTPVPQPITDYNRIIRM
jgi:hypothetical protein